MTKKKEGFVDFTGVDPAVSALLDPDAKPTDGRGKPAHAGELGVDKTGRSKATYNIPVQRQNLVREMADQLDVSQADIVEAAIVAFANAWETEQAKLKELREPARSLKVLWKLNVPDDFSLNNND